MILICVYFKCILYIYQYRSQGFSSAYCTLVTLNGGFIQGLDQTVQLNV